MGKTAWITMALAASLVCSSRSSAAAEGDDARGLFAQPYRALSHGCVRTDRATELGMTMAILGAGNRWLRWSAAAWSQPCSC